MKQRFNGVLVKGEPQDLNKATPFHAFLFSLDNRLCLFVECLWISLYNLIGFSSYEKGLGYYVAWDVFRFESC